MRRVQGLRNAKNRSLLNANEDFERERNEEITHRAQPKEKKMQFTLIHYTDGWRIGATVTLSGVPVAGTLVKASLDSPEDYTDIYYIDNILWGDGGENYLFVRPFEGYGEVAPLTESDRLRATMNDVVEAVDNLTDNVMEKLSEIV